MSITLERRINLRNDLIQRIGAAAAAGLINVIAIANNHNVTTQTVYRSLKKLEEDGLIIRRRVGKKSTFKLRDHIESFRLELCDLREGTVWTNNISPLVKGLPEEAFRCCNYIFTEMLNNAIDHSDGTHVDITVLNNEYRVLISIADNGVGIFSKISSAMGLEEKRFAVLELAKGKFTTDPTSHTGEGIFFSSKAADSFGIFSDELLFSPLDREDLGVDSAVSDYVRKNEVGTEVLFTVKYQRTRTMRDLFDKYTNEPDHYGFTKTVVPVLLLEYGDSEALFTSRSQAKRLLVRFEKFEHIILDFADIEEIGQGFADEIFRVFAIAHPNTKITPTHCSEQVRKMIEHVKAL